MIHKEMPLKVLIDFPSLVKRIWEKRFTLKQLNKVCLFLLNEGTCLFLLVYLKRPSSG